MSNNDTSLRLGLANLGRRGHAPGPNSLTGRRSRSIRPQVIPLESRQLLAAKVTIGNAAIVTEGNPGSTSRYAEFRVSITDWTASTSYTVNYGQTNNTAQAGSDFSPVSGQLTFRSVTGSLGGSTMNTQTIRVPIISDRVGEATETFFTRLTGVSSNLTIENGLGQATIEDDDRPTVALTPASLSVSEGGGSALLTVSLSNLSDLPVRVNLKTITGSATADVDYNSVSQVLTFNPRELSRVIPISIRDDATYERPSPESFQVKIESPMNAMLGNDTSTVSILDNDAPPPSVPSVSIAAGATTVPEASGNAAFYVSLSNKYSAPVTVRVVTTNGTAVAGGDFVGQSFTLTFQPGETDKGFSVPIVDDADDEDNEAFRIVLSAPTNATLGTGSATVTIVDDDVTIVRDSPGVYRAGTFYQDMGVFGYQLSDPTAAYGGFAGDKAVAGDWDGDGYDEPGIFRVVNGAGYFYLDTGSPGWQPTDAVVPFGRAGDLPVVGDWDGDSKDTPGVFQTINGYTYFVLDVGAAGYQATDRVVQYGIVGDLPIAGDWDGDRRDTPGVYRKGIFILDTGPSGWQWEDTQIVFGRAGDLPVAGDWDNDGKDNVGVFQNSAGVMVFVLDVGTPGYQSTDQVSRFGLPGDQPLVGRWKRR